MFVSSDIPIDVEQCRVVGRLVCQVDGDWRENQRRNPHAEERVPRTLFREFLAGYAYDIVNYEEYHRNDYRHAESAFADNRSERRTDEEENHNRHGQREFAVPFVLAPLELVQSLFRRRFVE